MQTFIRPDPDATCDPRHLAHLLGVERVDIEQEKVHIYGIPPADAQAIIDAYVYDPNWGKPADEVTARQRIRDEVTTLETELTTGWSARTTAEKTDTLRRMAVLTLYVIKFIARRFLNA